MNNLSQILVRLAESGTDQLDKSTKRRVVVINALMLVIVAMSLLYSSVLVIMDPYGFRAPILWMLCVAPLFLVTLRLWKINILLGTFYNLILWIIFEMTLSYFLGRDSGIHFLFLCGTTVSILIFGVRVNRMSLISLSVGVICFFFAHFKFVTHSEFVTASDQSIGTLFFISISIFIAVIFCMIYYAFFQLHRAESLLEKEYEYSEGLLTAMMPKSIADQLKVDRLKTIADGYESVSILFADLAGFTADSARKTPEEVIAFLNKLFTKFDHLVAKHDVEKIKTLGDSYMVAGGMPNRQPDHGIRVALLALDMLEASKELAKEMGEDFHLRIGFHIGPAVAGVIGTEKPFYDVWGDTVNTASRLETNGINDAIQVTKATKELLKENFTFKKRGIVEMKGKGKQEVWLLTGLIDAKYEVA